MPYRTIYGREIEYTYALAAKIHGSSHAAKSEEAKAWMTAYQRAFDELTNIEIECGALRDENKRLRHENEFMLRLVNEREQATYSAANSAVAAIRFALSAPEGMMFLRLWNEGEFDTLRREWPDAPTEIYIGADPLATRQQEGA